MIQAVLLREEWWDSPVHGPGGVGRPNERIVVYTVRQWTLLISPVRLTPVAAGHPVEERGDRAGAAAGPRQRRPHSGDVLSA